MHDALNVVWAGQSHLVRERVDLIEVAVAALADDRLETCLRCQAQIAAHMLAGSIGTFGFVKASQAAFSLELGLVDPTQDDAPALSALTLKIRDELKDDCGPLAQLRGGAPGSGAATPPRGSAQARQSHPPLQPRGSGSSRARPAP